MAARQLTRALWWQSAELVCFKGGTAAADNCKKKFTQTVLDFPEFVQSEYEKCE